MKIQVHIEEKILTILLPDYNGDGEFAHLAEPVFESQIVVDWLNENKINAVIALEMETNEVDLKLGSEENEKKFLAFIADMKDVPKWGKIDDAKNISYR